MHQWLSLTSVCRFYFNRKIEVSYFFGGQNVFYMYWTKMADKRLVKEVVLDVDWIENRVWFNLVVSPMIWSIHNPCPFEILR